MIQNEAPEDVGGTPGGEGGNSPINHEDVKRLPWVSEATGVIGEVPRGIILAFGTGSPRRTKGQVMLSSSRASHSFHILLYAYQASSALGHSNRQC